MGLSDAGFPGTPFLPGFGGNVTRFFHKTLAVTSVLGKNSGPITRKTIGSPGWMRPVGGRRPRSGGHRDREPGVVGFRSTWWVCVRMGGLTWGSAAGVRWDRGPAWFRNLGAGLRPIQKRRTGGCKGGGSPGHGPGQKAVWWRLLEEEPGLALWRLMVRPWLTACRAAASKCPVRACLNRFVANFVEPASFG